MERTRTDPYIELPEPPGEEEREPPFELPQYELHSIIAESPMAVIYRATRRALEREVAIKVLKGSLKFDAVAVSRFLQETRAAARLSHDHTVTLYDAGRAPSGQLYQVMELLEGHSLAQLFERDGAIYWERAVRIAEQICDSLTEAHEQGLVHRDLKPENVHVEQRRNFADYVTVLDFGVGKLLWDQSRARAPEAFMRTAAYMAPEVAQGGGVDLRCDIYSLGVMLFEMLTGQPPYMAGSVIEVLTQHITNPVPRVQRLAGNIRIPGILSRMVFEMMSKDPRKRPPTMMDVRRGLAVMRQPETMDLPVDMASPAQDPQELTGKKGFLDWLKNS